MKLCDIVEKKKITVASQTIFGEQIGDQIVCLIVNMWNALPRLLLCIFWQAPLQLMHKVVRVASAHAWLNACLCRMYGSEDIWVLQCKKKVHEQRQGFLGSPDLHLGLIHVEDWNIFCRKREKKELSCRL